MPARSVPNLRQIAGKTTAATSAAFCAAGASASTTTTSGSPSSGFHPLPVSESSAVCLRLSVSVTTGTSMNAIYASTSRSRTRLVGVRTAYSVQSRCAPGTCCVTAAWIAAPSTGAGSP
jgi:hypothetical protein